MEKIKEVPIVGTPRGPVVARPPVKVPKGINPDRFLQASQAKALMKAEVTEGGSVLVSCPYCIIYYRKKNPIDVTKFVDTDGSRECVTACNKGHVVKFRPIPQWREERQKMGLQAKP